MGKRGVERKLLIGNISGATLIVVSLKGIAANLWHTSLQLFTAFRYRQRIHAFRPNLLRRFVLYLVGPEEEKIL